MIYSPLGYCCCVFHFTGDKSERGTILSPDGQETLFMAKSLLTALVQRISDASITVAILEILKKYKDRFLELLEADSLTHNTKNKETERSLNERIGEIQEFQDLRTKLLSFIHMCELIRPGENRTPPPPPWGQARLVLCCLYTHTYK